MHSPLITSKKGFSILLALGAIGVLMVIVIGMIEVFLTEMKLSRYQYDYILASEQAEGVFEYAMLKVANHRDGFSDSMDENSKDQILFRGVTPRTEKNRVSYKIESNTDAYTTTIKRDDYLIFPLFVGNDILLDSPNLSKKPNFSLRSDNAQNITLAISTSGGDKSKVSWSVVAFDKNTTKNVSLSGRGEIGSASRGVSRFLTEECFASDGQKVTCTNSTVYERIQYFYDREGTIGDFLGGIGGFASPKIEVKDPYIMIFNGDNIPHTITVRAGVGKFALPDLTVTTDARKGNALQTIRFSSDKSQFYDAIKYSAYNTAP